MDKISFTYFCRVEKIYQHIEKLLAQHDYVVIPNLGGFVVQKTSAVILSDHITAPLSTIGFNPLMLHSDGLLAIEIARSEAISYRLAMEYVDTEVARIKTRLNDTGEIQFGNFGLLQQKEEGIICFIPQNKADYLPINCGLSDIYITERKNNKPEEKKRITLTLPSLQIYKYAAAYLLIAAFMCATPKLDDARKVDTAGLSSLISVHPSTTLNHSEKSILRPVVNPVTDTISKALPKNFHVVVASLGSRQSADDYCEILKSENFPEVHVLVPARIYRVVIQSFADKQEAIHYMETLRKSDKRFETAWVLCN